MLKVARIFVFIPALIMISAAARAQQRWQTLPEPAPMPAAEESGYAPVNGIKMYYAVFAKDKGAPILLIHGGLAHADLWASQVATLSKTHEVIVADSRGHGRSTRNDQPYSYDLMASDYLALLDYLGIRKVALVGWSDGGIIGLDIAIHHPERLTRLFAQAANANTDGVNPATASNPTFARFIERMRRDYTKMSKTPDQYDAFVEQISHMWATQPNWSKETLAGITTPTAIVAGDHDEAILRSHTDYLASAIPGATEIILPDASHFAMLQAPDEYSAAVLHFIDGK